MAPVISPDVFCSFLEYSICPCCRLLIHSSKFIDPFSFKKSSICNYCISNTRERNLIIDSSIQSVLGKKRRCKRSKGVLKQPLVVPQSSWRVVYQPANLKKSNVYVAKLIHHRLYV